MTGDQYLLLPGPTPIPERVVRAMSKPLINHRGPEFRDLILEVTEGIKQVCQTSQNLLIYPSSGSGALEAAVVNFISPGDKVLAVSIGAFGDRFATIAEKFGARVDKMDFPWGQAADAQAIKRRLDEDKNGEIKAILITHNETSTGVFNDIKTIREMTANHPALFMVDAVSSLAALELKMDEWKLDVVVSGSQKAFMIPPGLGFLAFSDRALAIHQRSTNCRFYWDVTQGLEYLEKGQTHFTPPISLYFGLREAINIMQEEGFEKILLRHRHYREMVRSSVKAMGLELAAADESASTAVTAVIIPKNIGANRLRQYMYEQMNIILAGGQQQMDDVIIRIGHVGYVRNLALL
ncbi:MAG: alanine--glyoxylate aminotransferase family protein, partial [Syntrophomonadaceae bacterium]|nr:alanine--glyoxylate aminotransferase family protein [Syntrophomonadaceae bacterium]